MIKNSFTTILCGIILLFPLSAMAGDNSIDNNIKKAQQELLGNPRLSALLSLKAINSPEIKESPLLKAKALFVYAEAERLLGNLDGSMVSLYEAIDVVPKSNKRVRCDIYNFMSLLYCTLTDYNKAIKLNDQAIALAKAGSESDCLARCYNNRGIIYTYLEEYQLADKFLMMALTLNRKDKNIKQIASNLNNLCLYSGNIKQKLGWLNECIVINKNLHANWSLGENYNNMGKQFFYAKKYPEALKALRRASAIANSIGAKELICDNYEYSSWVYSAMGNHKEAYKKLGELYNLSREIQSGNKLRTVEQDILYKKYQKQQQDNETKQQKYEVEILKRNITLLVFLLIMIIAITSFYYYWTKRKKNMDLINTRYRLEQSERELAEQKVKLQELELNSIHSELNDSRKETTDLAVFLKSRNELLDKIREMIKEGYRMEPNEQVAHFKRINAFIAQYRAGDNANNALLLNIEDKNQAFQKRLFLKHPKLTQGEKHLANLLRVNLSTKEIAMLTGNIPKTINMNRYRLRKALELPAEKDLIAYLQSI
jgi:tetratricopeptide (TPR) repeat protein